MNSHPCSPSCLTHWSKIRYRKSYAVPPISCEFCENRSSESHTPICRQPQLHFTTRMILVMNRNHETAQAGVSCHLGPSIFLCNLFSNKMTTDICLSTVRLFSVLVRIKVWKAIFSSRVMRPPNENSFKWPAPN
jgi:hypothetical protein